MNIDITPLRDYGPEPLTIDLNDAARRNNTFRTALWTGEHLQLTLMSINVGDDIGLEMHPEVDQMVGVVEGRGLSRMGPSRDYLNITRQLAPGYAVFVPAGTWHDLVNTGGRPLKLFSVYAPPNHPRGTVQRTKMETARETADESAAILEKLMQLG